MEEARLLRERLQALTEKRKIQEDIANKRTWIDEEKLKLQYLKKRALREQWLQDGLSSHNVQEHEAIKLQAQDHQEQAKRLQRNIHRMEKEMEALERQEMMISTNEAFILKRLKAVEKSPEDIIRAVVRPGPPEPVQSHSTLPDVPKSCRPPSLQKPPSPQLETEMEPAMVTMEMHVHKENRMREHFQHKGFRAYDDGRKSGYAARSSEPGRANRTDGLSPIEVEELLRKTTKQSSEEVLQHRQLVFSNPHTQPPSPRAPGGGVLSPGRCHRATPARPELLYSDGTRLGENGQARLPRPVRPYTRLQVGHPPANSGSIPSCFSSSEERRFINNTQSQGLRENHRAALFMESGLSSRSSPPTCGDGSIHRVPNTTLPVLDPSKPVTMIFMGYQHADDEYESKQALGYEDEIQAELVIIDDNDGEEDVNPSRDLCKAALPQENSQPTQHLRVPKANCYSRNPSSPHTLAQLQEHKPRLVYYPHRPYSDRKTDGDISEVTSTAGVRLE